MIRTIMVSRCCATTLLLLGVVGCAQGTSLLESDVPLPLGMETVRSADIRRAGGTVSGGRFLLAGSVDDAAALLADSIKRYEADGWSVVSRSMGLDHSDAVFAKGARRVHLAIDRRAVEPAMSSGMLEVTTVEGTAAEGTATNG